jgi:rhodanese-related sulfurtransferase
MKWLFFILSVSISCFAAVKPLSPDTLAGYVTSGTPYDFILVDVRDTSELDSVIGSSSCRPYHLQYNQGIFASKYQVLPKSAIIFIYCKIGGRGGNAAAILDNAGYTSVYNLTGGITAYHGPKSSKTIVRPLSDLPQPSMTAPVRVAVKTGHERGGRAVCARVAQVRHSNRLSTNVTIKTGSMSGAYDISGRLHARY